MVAAATTRRRQEDDYHSYAANIWWQPHNNGDKITSQRTLGSHSLVPKTLLKHNDKYFMTPLDMFFHRHTPAHLPSKPFRSWLAGILWKKQKMNVTSIGGSSAGRHLTSLPDLIDIPSALNRTTSDLPREQYCIGGERQ